MLILLVTGSAVLSYPFIHFFWYVHKEVCRIMKRFTVCSFLRKKMRCPMFSCVAAHLNEAHRCTAVVVNF